MKLPHHTFSGCEKAGNRKIFARTILKAPSLPLEGKEKKGSPASATASKPDAASLADRPGRAAHHPGGSLKAPRPSRNEALIMARSPYSLPVRAMKCMPSGPSSEKVSPSPAATSIRNCGWRQRSYCSRSISHELRNEITASRRYEKECR